MLDGQAVRFGIRQVELVREADDPADPHRFFFRVNGRGVFAKGANWIVPDTIPARVTEEKYRRLLRMAKAANMNMLRVWGGGVPETNAFYNLCDELGIMVWQDFPYACADYPEDAEFLALAEYEAEKIVKARRNHPSLVVWCGSNETLWLNQYGHRILYETLPAVCRRLDPYPGRLLREDVADQALEALQRMATPEAVARYGSPEEIVALAARHGRESVAGYFALRNSGRA